MPPDPDTVPAPSRATPPHRFRPRGASRPPRTPWEIWRPILIAAIAPIAAFVGAATATGDPLLLALMYASPLLVGGLLGARSSSHREGMGRGFVAGWAGYLLGSLVGLPLQVVRGGGAWTDIATAAIAAPFLGAIFGILFGLLAALGGYLGAKARGALRPEQVGLAPRA